MKKIVSESILLPAPQTFSLRYRTEDNEVKSYTISVPIAASEETFTAYAFKRGIRTFKNARVLALSPA
jgi:hypothetical protein